MRRREIIAGIGSAAALQLATRADAGNMARIGVLVTGSEPHPIAKALPRELAALGYIEGSAIAFDFRYADRSNDRARVLAKELVKSGCDVIVTNFTPATEAARDATTTIPIVMAPAGAPVEIGLVASLAHPGGNITGVTNLSTEIAGRRIQVLRDIVPNLKAIAAVIAAQDPFGVPLVDGLKDAGKRAGIKVEAFWRGKGEEWGRAFGGVDGENFQAVVVSGLPNQKERKEAMDLAAARRLPAMVFERDTILEGGLISVVGSSAEIYRLAAGLVARILKGARPADLPVEQPTTTETIVNLRAARRLGLTVPPSILVSADEVIE